MTDIPEHIMAEAKRVPLPPAMTGPRNWRNVLHEEIARALMGHEAALRNERDDARESYANLINVIADIREKSGVGGKPMLGELADAIEARIAAAEQRWAERAAKMARAACRAIAAAIRRGEG